MTFQINQQLLEEVTSALQTCDFKMSGDEMRMNAPYRASADSKSFAFNTKTGQWVDNSHNMQGGLYQLARKLGIAIPDNVTVPDTMISFRDLNHYAQVQGVPVDVFEKSGWKDTTYQGRPAILIPSQEVGDRVRFLDGKTPKYKPTTTKPKKGLYGFNRAVELAKQNGRTLILTNGQPSTVIGQHYGMATFCQTDGEKALPQNLVKQIQSVIDKESLKLWIALDCDDAGHKASQAIEKAIPSATVINLRLGNKGDLANHCQLFGADSYEALQDLAKQSDKHTPYNMPPDTGIVVANRNWITGTLTDYSSGNIQIMNRVIEIPFLDVNIPTGKCLGIGGWSGGGKTTLGSSILDYQAMVGYSCLNISPEWSIEEQAIFMLGRQRLEMDTSYVTYQDVLNHRLGKKKLSTEQHRYIHNAIDRIKEWAGDWQPVNLRGESDINKIIAMLKPQLAWLRERNMPIHMVQWDYIGVFDVEGYGNAEELKMKAIKKFAMQEDVLSVAITQITKSARDRLWTDGGFIRVSDLQGVRDDTVNYCVSINRQLLTNEEAKDLFKRAGDEDRVNYIDTHHGIKSDKRKPYRNENGEPLMTPNTQLFVLKNSFGKAYSVIDTHYDEKSHRFKKGLHPDWVTNPVTGRPKPRRLSHVLSY